MLEIGCQEGASFSNQSRFRYMSSRERPLLYFCASSGNKEKQRKTKTLLDIPFAEAVDSSSPEWCVWHDTYQWTERTGLKSVEVTSTAGGRSRKCRFGHSKPVIIEDWHLCPSPCWQIISLYLYLVAEQDTFISVAEIGPFVLHEAWVSQSFPHNIMYVVLLFVGVVVCAESFWIVFCLWAKENSWIRFCPPHQHFQKFMGFGMHAILILIFAVNIF